MKHLTEMCRNDFVRRATQENIRLGFDDETSKRDAEADAKSITAWFKAHRK